MKKTAVIYARQSSGDTEFSVSVENQIEACKKWCKSQGIEVAGVYSDLNTSSELYPLCGEGIKACSIDTAFADWQQQQLSKNRKQYKIEQGKAFEFIQEKKPNFLVVLTHNRLGRPVNNSYLMNFYNSFLMQNSCSLAEASTGNITDYSDIFMTAILNLKQTLDYQGVAEKRLQSLEAIKKRKNSGKAVTRAYGTLTNSGTISFEPEKAEVIKKIFTDFNSGIPLNQTLKELNSNYTSCLTAGAKQFYETNLKNILQNPVYCGFMKNSAGELVEATNIPAPVVSYSDFSLAQKNLQKNSSKHIHYNLKGECKHFLPLSGFLYCSCGRRMVATMDGGIVYVCKNCGNHTNRMRISSQKSDWFLKKISKFFIVSAVARRKKINAMKNAEETKNVKFAELDKKEKSLKAKFLLIETEEDFSFFKPEIEALKAEIKSLKAEILEIETACSSELEQLEKEIEKDIDSILNGVLSEKDFLALLRETIEKIVVEEKEIEIVLAGGNSVKIPFEIDKRNSKKLPEIEITVADLGGNPEPKLSQSELYFTIEIKTGKEKILLKNDFFAVVEQ